MFIVQWGEKKMPSDTCQPRIPVVQQDNVQGIKIKGECPAPSLYEGATFTPIPQKTAENELDLSWKNNRGLPNPTPVKLVAPTGPRGPQGDVSLEQLNAVENKVDTNKAELEQARTS